VISADSRQVYHGMDLGTGKVTTDEMQGIPHHLIDVVEPTTVYTGADFKRDAEVALKDIVARGKLPIIAGGTGLYLCSLLQNYQIPATDLYLRKKLSKYSLPELLQQLKTADPLALDQIDTKNKLKVIRALEYTLSFKNSLITKQQTADCPYDYLIFGLTMDRQMLYKKINQRVEQMIKNNLIEEAKAIYKKYPPKNLPALSGIGYKEIIDYLDKKITLPEAVSLIKKNSRHYAKRQATWFRRMEKQGIKIYWNIEIKKAEKIVKKFLVD